MPPEMTSPAASGLLQNLTKYSTKVRKTAPGLFALGKYNAVLLHYAVAGVIKFRT